MVVFREKRWQNRQDLVDVPTGNNVTCTVTGEFYYGIPFEGSDTIHVTGK
jgi:hypothetical protein